MNGELASVRGIVDLSAQDALDETQAFLAEQGYTTARRAGNSLTVERRSPDLTAGQAAPNISASTLPR